MEAGLLFSWPWAEGSIMVECRLAIPGEGSLANGCPVFRQDLWTDETYHLCSRPCPFWLIKVSTGGLSEWVTGVSGKCFLEGRGCTICTQGDSV